jgi:alcohol dehydrogenase
MALGHEAAGIVTSLGPGVKNLKVGQRVITTFLPRCEECSSCARGGLLPCEKGSKTNGSGELFNGGWRLHDGSGYINHHLGVSGFSEYAVIDTHSLVPIDDDVPAEIAAVIGCAVLTGAGALINNGQITKDDSVAIVGLGGVGMAAVLAAVAIGCRKIIAVDNQAEKLSTALKLGATDVELPADIEKSKLSASVVLEAVGHPAALETAMKIVSAGGKVITVGLPAPGQLATIEPLKITAEAITITGSYMGSCIPARDIPKFIDWWRDGIFPVEKLISKIITLEEINQAMDDLADANVLRQVIKF